MEQMYLPRSGYQSTHSPLDKTHKAFPHHQHFCCKDGSYSILNPICASENFADKWKEHPERQKAFFSWIEKLQCDFDLKNLMQQDRVTMGNIIKEAFGSTTGKAIFSQMGYEEANEVKDGIRKVDTATGNLSKTGIVTVPPSRHYGDV